MSYEYFRMMIYEWPIICRTSSMPDVPHRDRTDHTNIAFQKVSFMFICFLHQRPGVRHSVILLYILESLRKTHWLPLNLFICALSCTKEGMTAESISRLFLTTLPLLDSVFGDTSLNYWQHHAHRELRLHQPSPLPCLKPASPRVLYDQWL